MHVFITGGLGFVGRRLSQALLDAGHEVTARGRSKTVRKNEIEQLNDEIAFFTEPAFLMHERPIQSPSVRNTSSTLLSFYFNDVYDDGVTGKTSCQTGRRR